MMNCYKILSELQRKTFYKILVVIYSACGNTIFKKSVDVINKNIIFILKQYNSYRLL